MHERTSYGEMVASLCANLAGLDQRRPAALTGLPWDAALVAVGKPERLPRFCNSPPPMR